jgi:hypothetical protein
MRSITTIFLLGLITTAVAQKRAVHNNAPFQVIYAENVEDSKGQAVKQLDIIPIHEVLTVRERGFLSMVHYLGFPVQIDSDTSITIADLDTQLTPVEKTRRDAKYTNAARPNIAYLFVSEGKAARRMKLSDTGACHDCNFDLEIIYPPRYNAGHVLYKGDLCLTWQNTNASIYEVEIENFFGDKLKTYTSNTNSLRIDRVDLQELRKDGEDLLLRIKDLNTNKASVYFILKELTTDLVDFPYPCSIDKATTALMVGHYLEMSPRDYSNEAEKYFILAAALSDNEFYKTMLDNFKKRRE